MEIEVVVEQITGNMLRDTVGNSVVPVLWLLRRWCFKSMSSWLWHVELW